MQYAAASLRLAVLLMLPAALCGCDWFADEELPFAWAEPGYLARYRFVPVADSLYDSLDQVWLPAPPPTDNAMRFEIRVIHDQPPAFVQHYLREIPSPARANLPFHLDYFARKSDGLHGYRQCTEDEIVTYLRVPRKPEPGMALYERFCDTASPMFIFRVLETERVVDVPAGTFEVSVFQHQGRQGTGSLEYWNEGVGLVRVDKYDRYGGTHLGTYELAHYELP